MSKVSSVIADPRSNEPVIANFNFREKGKVQPKGYKDMCIDQEVTVMAKCKIKSIGSSWDGGATFSLEVSSCEIEKPAAAPGSIESAVDEAQKSRKRVM